MPVNHYETCKGAIGRAIELRCHDGVVHRGVIERVEPDGVWLSPLPVADGPGGPGVYAYGFGAGWWLVPFAAVAALAFLPWLWW